MTERVCRIWEQIRRSRPMVHSITNNVTMNDCANIILAAGGTAIMAQDEREAEEITAHSQALALNMGALRAQDAMLAAARAAKRDARPVVLDPVAAGASRLRREMCSRLLEEGLVSVIRGNASEIHALAAAEGAHAAGVEADALDCVTEETLAAAAAWAADFSRRTRAVILLSGAIDLATDGTRTVALRGGSEWMCRITGAGCMLTSLTAVCCGAVPDQIFDAAVTAAGVMKYCGERAYARVCEEMEGTASFRTRLIDAVSLLTASDLASGLRIQAL
ncbi:MAG: hydroxyethylthiazole kinase [Agathobaculum desmolans]|uniref:hydroxyethylthiazole kinase n=1 Tax=Agathobaculum desmolans TaxID=39484 RepID=UPI0039912FDD